MNIKPKCRYCGAKVKEFGDICKDCSGGNTDLMDIVNDDIRRMEDRQNEE